MDPGQIIGLCLGIYAVVGVIVFGGFLAMVDKVGCKVDDIQTGLFVATIWPLSALFAIGYFAVCWYFDSKAEKPDSFKPKL